MARSGCAQCCVRGTVARSPSEMERDEQSVDVEDLALPLHTSVASALPRDAGADGLGRHSARGSHRGHATDRSPPTTLAPLRVFAPVSDAPARVARGLEPCE